MSPESFNRLSNTSKEEFDRFVDWLFSHTLHELQAARGNMVTTKAAWTSYFRRGLKADLLIGELMEHLPELFRRTGYSDEEGPRILQMLKMMNFSDVGINPTETGPKFDGRPS
jgi:hypothetical protein